jgi:hypothetical protein
LFARVIPDDPSKPLNVQVSLPGLPGASGAAGAGKSKKDDEDW